MLLSVPGLRMLVERHPVQPTAIAPVARCTWVRTRRSFDFIAIACSAEARSCYETGDCCDLKPEALEHL
jgi:hypothetical protein